MTLEQQVREFYEGQRLSDAEVDAILAPGAGEARRLPLVLAGVAAAAAAAVVAFFLASPAETPRPRVAAPAAVEVDPNEPELVLPKNYGPPAVGARSNEPGTLSIISEPPGALVTVDGQRRGVTPLRIEGVEPGAHEVVLERNGRRETLAVTVEPGGGFNLRVRLEADAPAEPYPWMNDCKGPPARLSVSGVVRGCAVYWAGVRVGVAPLVEKKVPAGHCEMIIACPNGRWSNESVGVGPGGHMESSYAEEDWFYFFSPEDENYQEPPVGKRRRQPRKTERPKRDDAGAEALDRRGTRELEAGALGAEDLYRRGTKELKAGALEEAIQTFTRCVENHPRYVICYRALGIVHARAGHGPEAYRWYKEYLRVAPDAPDAQPVRQLLEAYEAQ